MKGWGASPFALFGLGGGCFSSQVWGDKRGKWKVESKKNPRRSTISELAVMFLAKLECVAGMRRGFGQPVSLGMMSRGLSVRYDSQRELLLRYLEPLCTLCETPEQTGPRLNGLEASRPLYMVDSGHRPLSLPPSPTPVA